MEKESAEHVERLPSEFMENLISMIKTKQRRVNLNFRVAGTTIRTDDNKSRQVELQRLKLREPPYDEQNLRLEIKQDNSGQNAVYIAGFNFGFVPKSDEDVYASLADFFDKVSYCEVKKHDGKYCLDVGLCFLIPAEPTDAELRAAEAVILSQNSSIAFIQNQLSIGYVAASKVADALHDFGITGDYNESHERSVLIPTPKEIIEERKRVIDQQQINAEMVDDEIEKQKKEQQEKAYVEHQQLLRRRIVGIVILAILIIRAFFEIFCK